MFRFTDLIQSHDAIEDVVARYPDTREVFESNGIRRSCWSCAIRTAAMRGEIDLPLLLEQLNRTALGPRDNAV
jgi:hypothetical protein